MRNFANICSFWLAIMPAIGRRIWFGRKNNATNDECFMISGWQVEDNIRTHTHTIIHRIGPQAHTSNGRCVSSSLCVAAHAEGERNSRIMWRKCHWHWRRRRNQIWMTPETSIFFIILFSFCIPFLCVFWLPHTRRAFSISLYFHSVSSNIVQRSVLHFNRRTFRSKLMCPNAPNDLFSFRSIRTITSSTKESSTFVRC